MLLFEFSISLFQTAVLKSHRSVVGDTFDMKVSKGKEMISLKYLLLKEGNVFSYKVCDKMYASFKCFAL